MLKSKKQPVRMCIGCREKKLKSQLLRIVKKNTGEIFVDDTGKQDGRGVYICFSKDCFYLLKKKRGLERSFKCKIDDFIYDELEKELNRN